MGNRTKSNMGVAGVFLILVVLACTPAEAVTEAQNLALDLFSTATCAPSRQKSLKAAFTRFVDKLCGVASEDINSVQVSCSRNLTSISPLPPAGQQLQIKAVYKVVANFTAPAGTVGSLIESITVSGQLNICRPLDGLCSDKKLLVPIVGGQVTSEPPPVVGGGSPSTITTFAGPGTSTGLIPGASTGVTATLAQLKNPNGVAVNSAGDVFIADAPTHTIKVVRAADKLMYVFAGVMSTKGSGADGAAATTHLLNTPRGVAVDANDTVWIADSVNHKIKRVPTKGPDAGKIFTVAGTGVLGYSGDGGNGINAKLNNPRALAFDSELNVYWSDVDGHRIRKVTHTTGIITTVAGNGVLGAPTLDPSKKATEQSINGARGLAIDPTDKNALYIADTGNSQVLKLLPDGSLVRVAGTGAPGSGPTGLNQPFGLALDTTTGTLYICDVTNQVVKVLYTPVPGNMLTFAGNGTAGSGGDGGAPGKASLFNTQALAIHQPTHRIFLAESGSARIRVVDSLWSWV